MMLTMFITFVFRFIQKDWLFTVDVKAIGHIVKKDTGVWQKPASFAYNLLQLLGPGIPLFRYDI